MKIKELTNAPAWLMKAVVEDEDVEIDANGRVIWNRGTWHDGDFRGGDFRGGAFRGGAFRGGAFLGGDFWGGDFWGGDFRGGAFRGGAFRGGAFLGGAFLGGDFWGGDFWGGDFRGGAFRGGAFLGGAFRGGDFRGGDFWGGDFWGEPVTVTPFVLLGLQWPIIISGTQMQIGCQKHKVEEWAEFDDSVIAQMDRQALRFWRTHKDMILGLHAAYSSKLSPKEIEA